LLARLDSNFITKDKDLISLPGILDQSLTRFKHQIADKKLKVELVFDQNKPLLVPQYYTTLIIDNILSNAIKYSKNNTALKIDVKETEKAIVCSIKDEGIGINENDLNHIYDSFFRSESLNHKQISGSGLGLSIAKKCADAIQADLRIESTFGQGTTVTITF
jgi:signal transduction histidine kinase